MQNMKSIQPQQKLYINAFEGSELIEITLW